MDVRTSDDVRNYVCGFVYFASLEWFWKKFGSLGERRVLFFHVTNMQRNEDYEEGRNVTVTLIKAVIGSCGL